MTNCEDCKHARIIYDDTSSSYVLLDRCKKDLPPSRSCDKYQESFMKKFTGFINQILEKEKKCENLRP